MSSENLTPQASIDIYWLPLGAGGRSVRLNGRIFEALMARREHRPACELYHAALEVRLGDARFVIEMAPSWDRDLEGRGVVSVGPVGAPLLGRSRWFRYEVRCWRGGSIPDVGEAVGGPRRISQDVSQARRVLELIPAFPTATWGRDELAAGDMWNSNSLVAWLLASSGHDLTAISPPARGRAPGWSAGLVVAARGRQPWSSRAGARPRRATRPSAPPRRRPRRAPQRGPVAPPTDRRPGW